MVVTSRFTALGLSLSAYERKGPLNALKVNLQNRTLESNLQRLWDGVKSADARHMPNHCRILMAEVYSIGGRPSPMQGPFFDAGVHNAAVAAIRWGLDNDHVSTVLACHSLLSQMVAWNLTSQLRMAPPEVGALAVSVEAIKKYGLKHPALMMESSLFRDFQDEARYEFYRLGGVDAAWNISTTRWDAKTQLDFQCFSSTVCQQIDMTKQLREMGWIKQSMKACRDFPRSRGIRGEVLAIFNFCFLANADDASVEEFVKYGVIDELVSTMHDEMVGHVELDVAGSSRLFSLGMTSLAVLSQKKPEWHAHILKQGAVETISDVLLTHRRPTVHLHSIDLESDLIMPACQSLRSLTSPNVSSIVKQELELHPISNEVRATIALAVQEGDPDVRGTCGPLV